MEIRALVDLPVGTEVEIDYCPDISRDPDEMFEDNVDFRFKMVAARQKIIIEKWGFKCACKACMNAEVTNDYRADCNTLDEYLRKKSPKLWLESYKVLKEQCVLYISWLIEQRIFCKVPRVCNYLIEATNIRRSSNKMGDEERFNIVANLMRTIAEAMQAEHGRDSDIYQRARSVYRDFTKGKRKSVS
jgi:hypothetical protein